MHSPLYLRAPNPRLARGGARKAAPRTCGHRCPGGGRCCLNADVNHALHICSNPRCVCHYRERYEEGYHE